jgi:hypothetical protein
MILDENNITIKIIKKALECLRKTNDAIRDPQKMTYNENYVIYKITNSKYYKYIKELF